MQKICTEFTLKYLYTEVIKYLYWKAICIFPDINYETKGVFTRFAITFRITQESILRNMSGVSNLHKRRSIN